MREIKIGTRGSQLALWQANYTLKNLRQLHPQHRFELVKIKTEGDRDQSSSLAQIGGMGLFTKAIEEALLNRNIDIAVHSLKDLPSLMHSDLILAAVPKRGPVEDVLVTANGISFSDLPAKAKIATGSIRRRSQLLKFRPDLNIKDLRGNINTRLSKMADQQLDGIIMARAAIIRLKLEEVNHYVFSTEEMIPAVGQGAIGIQCRIEDEEIQNLLKPLNDNDTFTAVSAERAFLSRLDSGCQFPVGAHAVISGDEMFITGFAAYENGSGFLKEQLKGTPDSAVTLGENLAEQLINRGADDIVRQYIDG